MWARLLRERWLLLTGLLCAALLRSAGRVRSAACLRRTRAAGRL